jgi:hypothetical protein
MMQTSVDDAISMEWKSILPEKLIAVQLIIKLSKFMEHRFITMFTKASYWLLS